MFIARRLRHWIARPLRTQSSGPIRSIWRPHESRLRLLLEALEDRTTPTTFTVTNTLDDGSTGSLRWAVNQVNADSTSVSTINFDIPGAGAQTISLTSALPVITHPVVIDGFTQTGSTPNTLASGENAVLNVVLDGTNAGASDALDVACGNSTVEGLLIQNFQNNGIHLMTNGGDTVEGNVIQNSSNYYSNPSTNLIFGGGGEVYIDNCSGNTIGGTTPAARNEFTNFDFIGIRIFGSAAQDNRVEGNFIGTDGNQDLAAGSELAVLIEGASDNIIGGTVAGSGNVIAGANSVSSAGFITVEVVGVASAASGNTIQGNFIGVDATGTRSFVTTNNNSVDLIGLDGDAVSTVIGGTTAGARNVIAQTQFGGIAVAENFGLGVYPTGTVIEGNYIGIDAAGTGILADSPLGSGEGIDDESGGTTISGNSISGGGSDGVFIDSNSFSRSGDVVENNSIYGNGGNGISAFSSGNQIERNSIYGNTGAGILVGGTDDRIEDNSIYGNGSLGINLLRINYSSSSPAPLLNEPGGPFVGPNTASFSTLTVTETGSDLSYSGTLNGLSDTTYWVAFGVFTDNGNAYDGSYYRFFTTDNSGQASFTDLTFPNPSDFPDDPGPLTPHASIAPPHSSGNYGQNYPVLVAAQSGSDTTVLGTFNGAPSTTFTLDFYGNNAADPSGYGQGQYDLGSNTVTTDANGNASFLITLPTATTAGEVISATATDPDGNTSEFSADITAQAAGASQTGVSIGLGGGPTVGTVQASVDGATLATFTPAGTLAVEGSTGAPDTYTINFGSTLTTPIDVVGDGTASGDTLVADGDTSAINVIDNSPGQVTWGAPVTETVDDSGVTLTILNPESPTANYASDPGSNTIINGGPGANTVTITATTGTGVVVNGGPSTNNYVLDLGSLAGPVTIANSNSTGTNNLTVVGAAGNNTITASGSQVTSGAQTIDVDAPLASATIDGGSGNNQITVDSLTVPVQSLNLNGGGGTNTFMLDNVGTDVAAVAVAGGTGSSAVQVQGPPPANLKTQGVTAGPAARVAFAAAPASNVAGFDLPGAVLAYVEDASGDLETSNNSTVRLTIVGGPTGGAFAAGSVTSVSAQNGVATFTSLAFTLSGTYTLKATDGSLTAATTAVAIPPNTGLLLLDPTGNSLSVSGNAAVNVTDDGAVVIDSSKTAAVTASGNASISATEIDIDGGVSASGNAAFHGVVDKGAAVMSDPLAGLAAPSQPSTQFTAGSYSGTLRPGTYVGGITVSGNNTVTLQAGIYYLKGGGLTVSGNATVTGVGVTIYITGLTGTSPTAVSISGNADMTLTPLTSGTYQGVVIFLDRTSTAAVTVSGNGALNTTGTLYAPGAKVSLSGNAGDRNPANTSLGAQWIVADLALSGNATFTISADANNRSADPNAFMVAGGPADPTVPIAALTAGDAQAAVQEALALWQAAGLDAATLRVLAGTTVTIAPLPSPYLGLAAPGVIYLDPTAAGYGWFTALSPTAAPPANEIDLLTVVSHELGHLFGLTDGDGAALMGATLAPGVRILPNAGDLLALHTIMEAPPATASTATPASGRPVAQSATSPVPAPALSPPALPRLPANAAGGAGVTWPQVASKADGFAVLLLNPSSGQIAPASTATADTSRNRFDAETALPVLTADRDPNRIGLPRVAKPDEETIPGQIVTGSTEQVDPAMTEF